MSVYNKFPWIIQRNVIPTMFPSQFLGKPSLRPSLLSHFKVDKFFPFSHHGTFDRYHRRDTTYYVLLAMRDKLGGT
jgi:hypothetical protein